MINHPSYNPPSKENWRYTHAFEDTFKDWYDLGYFDARAGRAADIDELEFSADKRRQELDFWYSEGVFDYMMREEE